MNHVGGLATLTPATSSEAEVPFTSPEVSEAATGPEGAAKALEQEVPKVALPAEAHVAAEPDVALQAEAKAATAPPAEEPMTESVGLVEAHSSSPVGVRVSVSPTGQIGVDVDVDDLSTAPPRPGPNSPVVREFASAKDAAAEGEEAATAKAVQEAATATAVQEAATATAGQVAATAKAVEAMAAETAKAATTASSTAITMERFSLTDFLTLLPTADEPNSTASEATIAIEAEMRDVWIAVRERVLSERDDLADGADDGLVSVDELFAYTLAMFNAQGRPPLRATFLAYDADRTGSLDAAEVQMMADDLGFGPYALDIFTDLDRDGGGTLEYAEILQRLTDELEEHSDEEDENDGVIKADGGDGEGAPAAARLLPTSVSSLGSTKLVTKNFLLTIAWGECADVIEDTSTAAASGRGWVRAVNAVLAETSTLRAMRRAIRERVRRALTEPSATPVLEGPDVLSLSVQLCERLKACGASVRDLLALCNWHDDPFNGYAADLEASVLHYELVQAFTQRLGYCGPVVLLRQVWVGLDPYNSGAVDFNALFRFISGRHPFLRKERRRQAEVARRDRLRAQRANSTLGLMWVNIGPERPTKGTQLQNPRLTAELLAHTDPSGDGSLDASEVLSQPPIQFTREQLDGFCLAGLTTISFIRAGDSYYEPMQPPKPSTAQVVDDSATRQRSKIWTDAQLRKALRTQLGRLNITPHELLKHWDQGGDGELSRREFLINLKKLFVPSNKPPTVPHSSNEEGDNLGGNDTEDGGAKAVKGGFLAPAAASGALDARSGEVPQLLAPAASEQTRAEALVQWDTRIRPAVVATFDRLAGKDASLDSTELYRWVCTHDPPAATRPNVVLPPPNEKPVVPPAVSGDRAQGHVPTTVEIRLDGGDSSISAASPPQPPRRMRSRSASGLSPSPSAALQTALREEAILDMGTLGTLARSPPRLSPFPVWKAAPSTPLFRPERPASCSSSLKEASEAFAFFRDSTPVVPCTRSVRWEPTPYWTTASRTSSAPPVWGSGACVSRPATVDGTTVRASRATRVTEVRSRPHSTASPQRVQRKLVQTGSLSTLPQCAGSRTNPPRALGNVGGALPYSEMSSSPLGLVMPAADASAAPSRDNSAFTPERRRSITGSASTTSKSCSSNTSLLGRVITGTPYGRYDALFTAGASSVGNLLPMPSRAAPNQTTPTKATSSAPGFDDGDQSATAFGKISANAACRSIRPAEVPRLDIARLEKARPRKGRRVW